MSSNSVWLWNLFLILNLFVLILSKGRFICCSIGFYSRMWCRCTGQRPLSLVCLRQVGLTNGSWLLSLEAVRALKGTLKGLKGSLESSNCLIGMYTFYIEKCLIRNYIYTLDDDYELLFVSDWIHWSLDLRHSCSCVDAMTLCTGRTTTSSTCFFRHCPSSSVGLAGLGLMSRASSLCSEERRWLLIFCKNKKKQFFMEKSQGKLIGKMVTSRKKKEATYIKEKERRRERERGHQRFKVLFWFNFIFLPFFVFNIYLWDLWFRNCEIFIFFLWFHFSVFVFFILSLKVFSDLKVKIPSDLKPVWLVQG